MSHFEQTLTLWCVWILRDDLLVSLSNNVFSTGFVVRFLTSDIRERQQLAAALVRYATLLKYVHKTVGVLH